MAILAALVRILLLVSTLMLFMSVNQLSPIEMGLKYNYILCTVSPKTYSEAGLYFFPFGTFKKYPKTVQTINLDVFDKDLLDGRTSDGLPLFLGASFQYQLDPHHLFRLYSTFGDDYLRVFQRVGAHLITEMATNFTAYQFFNEKQRIADHMQRLVNEYFAQFLFAFVESFQINEDELPKAFYDAVLAAATTKQNITRMQKILEATKVGFLFDDCWRRGLFRVTGGRGGGLV